MDCDNYRKQVSELIDNELNQGDGEVMFRHLGECRSCRQFFRSCLHMKEALQTISYHEIPVEKPEHNAGWMRTVIRVPLPAAAVFILLFITGMIGTSYHFFQDREIIVAEQYQIIYTSEYPEIEIHL